MKNTVLDAIIAILMLFGVYSFLGAFLPKWIVNAAIPFVALAFIGGALLVGRSALWGIMRTVAVWTWPFWIFGLARYVIAMSPLTALMPPAHAPAIINVIAPALVSIAGWLFWRFARFQELARDVGVVLSLVVHLFTLAAAFMDDGGRIVMAWGLGSLAVTLGLAMTLYAHPTNKFFGLSAAGSALLALILSITFLIWPVDKPRTKQEVIKEKVMEKVEQVKESKEEVKEAVAAEKEKLKEKIEDVKDGLHDKKRLWKEKMESMRASEMTLRYVPKAPDELTSVDLDEVLTFDEQ